MKRANSLDILFAEVEAWRDRPFSWCGWSCCEMAAEHVFAVTGVDHRGAFPAYASQTEAETILKGHGGMVALLTSVLGEPVPVARAKRGDIVAADFGMGMAAGICLGVRSCAPGARGLQYLPTAQAVAAWIV